MKKFWKYIAAGAVVACLAPLTACDDDDEVDPYDINYCYVYQPNSTFATVEYNAKGDFLVGPDEPLEVMPVRATKPAPSNIQVEIAFDPALVDEYNEENGTDYKFLEGAELLKPVLTIQAGKYISDDVITIGFTDHSGFMVEETNLMLPVVIRNAGGLTISKSSRIFLTFNSTYRPNLLTVADDVTFKATVLKAGWENDVRKLEVNNAVRLSYTPYEDVTVRLSIDQSKVAEYNAAHGTSYQFKSDARLDSDQIKLTTEDTSGSLSITTGDLSGIAAGNSYLIPVVITGVDGASIEYTPSESIVYVVVKSVTREIAYSESKLTGPTLTIPANAKVTVNGEENYVSYESIPWIDIIRPGWDYGYLNAGDEMVIDFGETVKISGFYSDNYYRSSAPLSITLETSVDGVTWIDWGEASWTTAQGDNYFKLSMADDMRYMKIVYPTCYGRRIEVDEMQFYTE